MAIGQVIILRPQPGADATAARAHALGLDPIVAPLFENRALDWSAPDPADIDALVMTSAAAARLAGPKLGRFVHLPLYAVGKATARAASSAGFARVTTSDGDGDGASLARIIPGHTRLLHLAATERRQSFGGVLAEVYRTDPLPLPNLPATGIVLFHSPRAAKHFAAVSPHPRSGYTAVAISAAAASAAGAGWRALHIAPAPDDTAMLEVACRLCKGQ